jgi:hypothetical protein
MLRWPDEQAHATKHLFGRSSTDQCMVMTMHGASVIFPGADHSYAAQWPYMFKSWCPSSFIFDDN